MTTSLSRQRRNLSSEGQPGSVVWFISFGDLLTLLLCFFLVLTPWDRLKSVPNTQSLRPVTSNNSTLTQRGTTFASDPSLRGSVINLELPIFVEDEGGDGFHTLKLGNLEQELRREMSEARSAEVLVCGPLEGRARLVHEVEEMFRRSDSNKMSRRFTISRSCENDRVLVPVTERVVGRIRILGM
jgi:hypothetical protein